MSLTATGSVVEGGQITYTATPTNPAGTAMSVTLSNGAVMLIALWGFAFGAFPACASIWMFVVAPKDVERGMPLFVALFQVIIALGSFFGGRIVDQMGSSVLLSLATVLVGFGFATVLVLGRKVSNSLVAQPA